MDGHQSNCGMWSGLIAKISGDMDCIFRVLIIMRSYE